MNEKRQRIPRLGLCGLAVFIGLFLLPLLGLDLRPGDNPVLLVLSVATLVLTGLYAHKYINHDDEI